MVTYEIVAQKAQTVAARIDFFKYDLYYQLFFYIKHEAGLPVLNLMSNEIRGESAQDLWKKNLHVCPVPTMSYLSCCLIFRIFAALCGIFSCSQIQIR